MMRIVIVLVLGLVGGGAGFAAGIFLRPAPSEDVEMAMADDAAAEMPEKDADKDAADMKDTSSGVEEKAEDYEGNDTEIVKLSNQFVVPVVRGDRVAALVVLSLSMETKPGGQLLAYEREPKLRDAFLRVLFDHANAGGFNGNFTAGNRMETLKKMLRGSTKDVLDDNVLSVFITEIARQDR